MLGGLLPETARKRLAPCPVPLAISYIVHLSGRLLLFLIVAPEACYRRHVIIVLAFGAGLVGCILARVFLDVFYSRRIFSAAQSPPPCSVDRCTFDFDVVVLRLTHEQGGGLAVQRVCRVRVA